MISKEEQEQHLLDLRREKVQELLAQRFSLRQIADKLNISHMTANRDAQFIYSRAAETMKDYDRQFPARYESCLTLLDLVISHAVTIATTTKDERTSLAGLSLVKDCIALNADLLMNVSLVDRTVTYVQSVKKKVEQLEDKTDEGQTETQELIEEEEEHAF